LSRTVDYYFTPQSPWTFLGHARFAAMAKATHAIVRLRPVDFGAVFPASGGLPLAKRAPQRQAYRLAEMARFSKHLGIQMNFHPKFFPVSGDAASKLIIAVDLHDGTDTAMRLCAAVFSAVWVQDRDIADLAVLSQLVEECGLSVERAAEAQGAEVEIKYRGYTHAAIEAQVFGAPSYVIDGEIFWGQDRLEFVARALSN